MDGDALDVVTDSDGPGGVINLTAGAVTTGNLELVDDLFAGFRAGNAINASVGTKGKISVEDGATFAATAISLSNPGGYGGRQLIYWDCCEYQRYQKSDVIRVGTLILNANKAGSITGPGTIEAQVVNAKSGTGDISLLLGSDFDTLGTAKTKGSITIDSDGAVTIQKSKRALTLL